MAPGRMNLPGLPEGVEAVRIGKTAEDEFELIDSSIVKGGRTFSNSHLVVRPAEGFEFVFDVMENHYVAVPKMSGPTTLTAKFGVNNSLELATLKKVLANLPGFQSLD